MTHGLSAILFFVAALHSARASRLALTAFGWYYAYDAIIYLVTGVLAVEAAGRIIGLNIPHVIISGIMLWLAYRGRTNVPSAVRQCPPSARTGATSSPRFRGSVRKPHRLVLLVVLPIVVLLVLAGLRNVARSRTFQLFGTLVAEAHPRDRIVALTLDDGPVDSGRRLAHRRAACASTRGRPSSSPDASWRKRPRRARSSSPRGTSSAITRTRTAA